MDRSSTLYKITYRNGKVKYATYKVLKNVLGHQTYWNKVTAIGAARMPWEFADVTEDFLTDADGASSA